MKFRGIESFKLLGRLVSSGNAGLVIRLLSRLSPREAARAVAHLRHRQRGRLFDLLSSERSATLVRVLPTAQAADILVQMGPAQAAAVVTRLPDARAADVLAVLPAETADAVLGLMSPAKAARVRRLLSYAASTAGGLMTTDFLSYPASRTVEEVVTDFRTHSDEYRRLHVQYVYVVADTGDLAGVLRLRDLLLAPTGARLEDIMVRAAVRVHTGEPLERLAALFQQHHYIGIPVVDEQNRIAGVVEREAVVAALGDRSQEVYLKLSGIPAGEELRFMPWRQRMRRRLSWLTLNVFLNLLAASVIAVYQDTISAAVVLAVFLPIISDMSGCSGNQAVAVSIRELALGLVNPRDMWRVVGKELAVGAANGVLLGLLLGTVAFVFQGNLYLGFVVGLALALNTMLSVCLGGLLPLVLTRLRVDPAVAASPILTTVTDMCGFFFVLSFATALLSRLAV